MDAASSLIQSSIVPCVYLDINQVVFDSRFGTPMLVLVHGVPLRWTELGAQSLVGAGDG